MPAKVAFASGDSFSRLHSWIFLPKKMNKLRGCHPFEEFVLPEKLVILVVVSRMPLALIFDVSENKRRVWSPSQLSLQQLALGQVSLGLKRDARDNCRPKST